MEDFWGAPPPKVLNYFFSLCSIPFNIGAGFLAGFSSKQAMARLHEDVLQKFYAMMCAAIYVEMPIT